MAGKYSGILLCSDFDGTLTQDGGTVSRENREAILRFEEQGGLFTMASGRYPEYLRAVEGLRLNAPAVTLNGNVIYDFGRERPLWQNTLVAEAVGEVLHVLNRFNGWEFLRVCTLCGEFTYYCGEDTPVCDFVNTIGDNPTAKLVAVNNPRFSEPLRKSLEKSLPELMFTASWPAGLEMNSATGGKGNAVKRLRELLGGKEKIKTVICVGDYENDISMLKYADISYAVDNAIDEVKAVADRITVNCRDHAIARIIEDL